MDANLARRECEPFVLSRASIAASWINNCNSLRCRYDKHAATTLQL